MHWALIEIYLWNKILQKSFTFDCISIWIFIAMSIYRFIKKEKKHKGTSSKGKKLATPDEENTWEKHLNINKWTITEG